MSASVVSSASYPRPADRVKAIPTEDRHGPWTLQRLQRHTVEDENGCWNWQRSLTSVGYGRVVIRRSWYGAHRVAWTLANGPVPPGMYVLHDCHNRRCCNPEHLRPGTPADNNDDTLRAGRHSYVPHRGESNGSARLTEADVRAIRASADDALTVAARYEVSRSLVYQLRRRVAWRSVA